MSPQLAVFLGFVVACLVVVVVGLGALDREAKRLKKRVDMVRALPPSIDLARTTADVGRLALAAERIAALSVRATAALTQLRAQVALLNRLVRGFPGPA
jgi:hypothetical protein